MAAFSIRAARKERCLLGLTDSQHLAVLLAGKRPEIMASKQLVQGLEHRLDGDGGHAAEEFGGRATNSAAIIAIVVQVPARDGGIGDQREGMTAGFNRFVPGWALDHGYRSEERRVGKRGR